MDSTAKRLDGQTSGLTAGLLLGMLIMLDVSSGEYEHKILCKGETPDVGRGSSLVSG